MEERNVEHQNSNHLGFGLPLLIPGLNILLLSFAPVGAAMYEVEQGRQAQG